ncbi:MULTISPECIES: NAD(+)/NADH kinase [unclassified Streptomyces]|uniref:NAD(+)/NADH kinase n=1 Tax=unclassified Streptomyces TaxID=2593676 RepID=UPI00225710FB|nr:MULTISPECIES: NAD(+)/NADH kinase [unclassified Streptomyces]MCX5285769.1 NAD(+)/NADH kinase [Streptomyces sp. NBC_00198]
MAVRRVGLVVHQGRTEADDAARAVHDWCAARGIRCTEIDVWAKDHQRRGGRAEAEAAGNPDLVVTLGGDGTFLRGARIALKSDASVLGVDLGKVGFLTEVPAAEVTEALDSVHDGHAVVEERMTLTMRASRALEIPAGMEALLHYGRGPALPPPLVRPETTEGDGWGVALDVMALNDVVLEKLARDRQVSVGVYIAGRRLASYSADAFAVATPTGSTAYSFAAGGPVLSPHMDAVVFTPIAPHMTFNRSVVAAPDEPVALRVLPHSGQAAVSIDGQLRGVVDPGDWIGVFRAPQRVRLIRLRPTDFYGRLRERFRLTDAPATAADAEAAPFFRPDSPIPPDLAGLRLPPPSAAR